MKKKPRRGSENGLTEAESNARLINKLAKNREVPKSSKISRGQMLTIGAIAIALGGGYVITSRGCDSGSSDTGSEHAESSEKLPSKEITLGKVRFYYEDPESLPEQTRQEQLRKLKNAYSKLCEYFGNDLMRFPYSIDLPISFESNDDLEKSQYRVRTKADIRRGDDASIELVNRPKLLHIQIGLNEKYICHELVHLFLQPLGGMISRAFLEGHAHTIEQTLYGQDAYDKELIKILDNPHVKEIIDTGFDYNQADWIVAKGGISSSRLEDLVRRNWVIAWEEFLKIDPEFFKKFYKEIARLKSKGEINFPKEQLVKIAGDVSPLFAKWYAEKNCFRDVGDQEGRFLKAVKMANGDILVFNFYTVGRKKSPQKIPFMRTFKSGSIYLNYTDTQGQKRRGRIKGVDSSFFTVGMKKDYSVASIEIGSEVIPVEL